MRIPRAALPLALAALLPGTAAAESFSSWAAKAERALKKKDQAEAISAYTNALSAWKKSDGKGAKAKALTARAGLHEKGGDLEKAVKDLGEALAIETKSAALYHRRGKLYMRLSSPSNAITDFYKAIGLDINMKEAYLDRGEAYEQEGDAQFAREDYKTACNLGLKKACAKAAEVGKRKQKAPAPPSAGLPPQKSNSEPRPEPPARPTVKEAAPEPGPPPTPAPPPAVKIEEQKPAPRPEPAPAPPPPPAPLPPPAPAPKVEEKPAPAPAPKPKPDFKACIKALEDCTESGDSFAACVKKAEVCESNPEKGCCPDACLKEFDRLVGREESEAEAFRKVFEPKAKCAVPAP